MINPQLLNYVRAQRSAGVPKEEIIRALSGGGWSAQDANEAFAAIEGVQVPPAAPRPAPPPITPAPQPVVQQPIVQQPAPQPHPIQPISPRVQPVATVQQRSVYSPVRKRRVWPWLLLLVIFLFGGIAGGAYLAVEYPWATNIVLNIKSMISPPAVVPNVEEDTNNDVLVPPTETGTSTGATSTPTTTP